MLGGAASARDLAPWERKVTRCDLILSPDLLWLYLMKQVRYPLFSSHRDVSSPAGSEKHFKLKTEDMMKRREQQRYIGPNIEHSESVEQ